MQSSTGQCASQIGEPAQLEQFSFITASSAVPLRFFASAIGFYPRPSQSAFESPQNCQCHQYPPKKNQADAAPFEPVHKIRRTADQAAQNLLSAGIVALLFQHTRHALQRALILGIELQRLLEIVARLAPFSLFDKDPAAIAEGSAVSWL